MRKHYIIAALCCAALAQQGNAQLTPQHRDSVIQNLAAKLESQYVFPEAGAAAAKKLQQYHKEKRYHHITAETDFAAKLTEDLQAIVQDKHLRVGYSPEVLPPVAEMQTEMPPSQWAAYGEYLKHDNYGINKLEVLKGNIGYIDFKYFCSPAFAGDSYVAMMNYIAHTDALIIDLRRCGGSQSPDAIPLIASYLFERPVHLNDIYWRKGNNTIQSWTYAQVQGKRYIGKPVYVLTSKGTFSGAEEFAYDLQNLKRATIIGGVTGGGANPGGDVSVTSHFRVFMPVGRAINPITKTNWEGVGVRPDSLIHPSKALYAATLMALDTILKTNSDEGYKNYLRDVVLAEAKASQPIYQPVSFELKGFANARTVYVAGSFNSWEPNELQMERKGDRWVATAEAEPGKVTYKFIVDGQWITDPSNTAVEQVGSNTNSVMFVQKKF